MIRARREWRRKKEIHDCIYIWGVEKYRAVKRSEGMGRNGRRVREESISVLHPTTCTGMCLPHVQLYLGKCNNADSPIYMYIA